MNTVLCMEKSPWKTCILLGEFIRRKRNTSSIPQMWPLDKLSPKFIINPENDYTPRGLQQQQNQSARRKLHLLERDKIFCIVLVRSFFCVHIVRKEPCICIILVTSEMMMSFLQNKQTTKNPTSLSNN